MLDRKTLDELVSCVMGLVTPAGERGMALGKDVAEELRAGLRQALEQAFSRLNILTREEFEVSQQALERAEQRIAELEQQMAELEARLAALRDPVADN